jgi:hypothetical protein
MKKAVVILLVGVLLATWSEGHAPPKHLAASVQTVAAR